MRSAFVIQRWVRRVENQHSGGLYDMNVKLICGFFCVLALACVSNLRAADAGKRGPNMAQMLLDHADDLGLTADQKTKLEEMAKAPTPLSVLTDEQRKKVREI